MAWSWSHTTTAYENALDNVQKLSDEKLSECYGEFMARIPNYGIEDDLDEDKYSIYYDEAIDKINFNQRFLIEDRVIDFMNDLALCDDGGYRAWCCPFGCHTVSFDKE